MRKDEEFIDAIEKELKEETGISFNKNELTENFKVKFVSKEELIKILNESHENATNGIYFNEEN